LTIFIRKPQESELVSGFMTEHAAVIFVFFFLAEYGSIVLICILNTVLFLGGYLLDLSFINSITYVITDSGLYLLDLIYNICHGDFSLPTYIPYDTDTNLYSLNNKSFIEGILSGFAIGIKSCIMIFIFIWTRASFPRIRFDQLMSFCWTILLPIIIAFIVLIPCVVISFEIIPTNISLL